MSAERLARVTELSGDLDALLGQLAVLQVGMAEQGKRLRRLEDALYRVASRREERGDE